MRLEGSKAQRFKSSKEKSTQVQMHKSSKDKK
jgi:hypothetical protein